MTSAGRPADARYTSKDNRATDAGRVQGGAASFQQRLQGGRGDRAGVATDGQDDLAAVGTAGALCRHAWPSIVACSGFHRWLWSSYHFYP